MKTSNRAHGLKAVLTLAAAASAAAAAMHAALGHEGPGACLPETMAAMIAAGAAWAILRSIRFAGTAR